MNTAMFKKAGVMMVTSLTDEQYDALIRWVKQGLFSFGEELSSVIRSMNMRFNTAFLEEDYFNFCNMINHWISYEKANARADNSLIPSEPTKPNIMEVTREIAGRSTKRS